jgi:purine nucleoside permease
MAYNIFILPHKVSFRGFRSANFSQMKRLFPALVLLTSLYTYGQPAMPIPVRVVIVTMFEIGADTGDRPGEFQYWVERLPLSQTIPFPQGYRNLRYNAEKQVLGICTGMGTARSAASIMALGMDPRFDLSHAYWLVAGISGIDPQDERWFSGMGRVAGRW